MGTGASFICKSNRWRQTVGVGEGGERRQGTENDGIQIEKSVEKLVGVRHTHQKHNRL